MNTGDPRNTVWGDQVKALDKARGAEQTIRDSAERTREAESKASY